MVKKVITRPNPFNTFLTLNVICERKLHVVVRMTGERGEIVKMFGWDMIKGTNITTICETEKLIPGRYDLCILDGDGVEVYSTQMEKT